MLNATEKDIAVKDLEVDMSKDAQDKDDEDAKPKNGKEDGVTPRESYKRALTDEVSIKLLRHVLILSA